VAASGGREERRARESADQSEATGGRRGWGGV